MFKPELASQLIQAFGGCDAEWSKILRRLSDAMARGDTCVRLSSQEIKTAESQEWVGASGESPFVLEGNRLYFQRYWRHEVQLSERLKRMAQHREPLSQSLDAYFTDEHQKAAAELVLSHQLALITGGPGTGKTTTVVKILTLLLMQNPALEIALAAPTGKAAMRLTESIVKGKADETFVRSVFSEHLAQLDAVPNNAKTLHRLLGVKMFTPDFRHNAENPLTADVVVVDEASMIDIGMMSRLLQAIKPSAKLILMGDSDQLASVESGAVLADVSQGLPENGVHLQTTFRFSGAIKALAEAVNSQNTSEVARVLADGDGVVELLNCDLVEYAKTHYLPYWQAVNAFSDRADIAAVFAAFNRFQVLTATRVDKARFDYLSAAKSEWYSGRPVMILENHAEQSLFNGDIGICLPDGKGALKVYFEIDGGFKAFMPSRLPKHETAYAMTIHKSQGSEFKHVFMVLPENATNKSLELLTKELIYTGITRAKDKVSIAASIEVLNHAVLAKVQRVTGLQERLL